MASAVIRRGRTQKADGAGPRKQVGYRPDEDVLQMVKHAASVSGRSVSAEIDAVLRRAYIEGQQDRAELEDLFGGPTNFAYGYLMARIRVGIEAEHQMNAAFGNVVDTEVRAAHDLIMQAADGTITIAQIKHARTNKPGTGANQAAAFVSHKTASPAEVQAWHRVLLAIHKNLTSQATELWWPLSDLPAKRRRSGADKPPLRPSLEQLRAVWPFRDTPTAQSN
jgi:hypothetical protein